MNEVQKVLQQALEGARGNVERFAKYRDEAQEQADDWEQRRAEAERRMNELEDFFAGTVLAETETEEEVSESDAGGGADQGKG